MEPEDVFLSHPVYRWEDVVTQSDLRAAIRILEATQDQIPSALAHEKHDIDISISTLYTMLDWVIAGKPGNFNMEPEQ